MYSLINRFTFKKIHVAILVLYFIFSVTFSSFIKVLLVKSTTKSCLQIYKGFNNNIFYIELNLTILKNIYLNQYCLWLQRG